MWGEVDVASCQRLERPGAGLVETKTGMERGEGSRLPQRASGLCCVTPGLGDPSCPTLASSCPGNQVLVIHPELPSLWSRGETAEPLVRAGVATSLIPVECLWQAVL